MSKETQDHDVLIQELRERIGRLTALVEQQQHQIEWQRDAYDQRLAHVQAEIAALSAAGATGSTAAAPAEQAPRRRSERRPTLAGRRAERAGSSRRALLKWGGAAAAAATVALVASEQGARAAPANNGDAIFIGQVNTGTSLTVLNAGTGATGTMLLLDNSTGSGDGLHVFSSSGSAGIYSYGNGTGDGVQGETGSTGNGVFGLTSGTGNGVKGQAGTGGNGVVGFAPGASGFGVWGRTDSGWGLVGQATTGIDIVTNGANRILQNVQSFAGAPTAGTYSKGEQMRDHNGELWLCVQSGTPGHWVLAAHAVYGYTGGATTYLSKPIRLLDTRSGATDALTNGGGPYTSGGSPYPVTIAGVSFMSVTVPSSCAGAIGNMTVVAGGGGGYLALVPHGVAFSGTANLAYSAGQIVSNAFNVGLSSDGKLDIIIGGNPTDVILDLFAVVA